MSITGLTPGDIVLCDVKGQTFYGIFVRKVEGKREVEVEPIPQRIKGQVRIVKSTEVKTRFKKMGRS